jgi:hypothetical protein
MTQLHCHRLPGRQMDIPQNRAHTRLGDRPALSWWAAAFACRRKVRSPSTFWHRPFRTQPQICLEASLLLQIQPSGHAIETRHACHCRRCQLFQAHRAVVHREVFQLVAALSWACSSGERHWASCLAASGSSPAHLHPAQMLLCPNNIVNM